MAGEAEVIKGVAGQGAGEEHLNQSDLGTGNPAPKINNGPNGDGVVAKEDDAATKAAADAAAKVAADKAAADAAAKKDDDDEELEKPITEWASFDDPSAEAAINLLKAQGVTPAEANTIFNKAVLSGDLKDIDVAALEAKIGKDAALLVMNGVRDYHQKTTKQNTETVDMVKGIFGGDAGWDVVKAWAQTKEAKDPAFKAELDSIREDLNKGGRAAKGAAKDLLKLYNGAPDTKGLGAVGKTNLVKVEGKSPANVQPMSRADYLTELKKAHAEGANPTEIAQLDARRLAGMSKGI